MSAAIHVAYIGFEAKPNVREYTFAVRGATADQSREVKLTISNQAFLSQRARYQDAPDICSHRLQRELANADDPLKPHYSIGDAELDEYRIAHSPKSSPGRKHKPAQEP